jgi:hypothetical protein
LHQGEALHDHPMFRALMVILQTQLLARLHANAFYLIAGLSCFSVA